MNLQSYNKSVNFGWHYPMHAEILKSSKNSEMLETAPLDYMSESVQKPDLEEFNLYGQSHFYYPNDRIKSYLDYSGKNNAKVMYNKHINDYKIHSLDNNQEKALDSAGRALHYLQDMTQPNHIESGSIIRKAIDKNMHADFERMSFDSQYELLDNQEPMKLESNDFTSLFDEVVNVSMQNGVPSKKNIEEWPQIAQNAVDLAVGATNKFIEIMELKE